MEVLLYDFDAYSRHHSIGGVQFPLSNFDLNEKIDIWKNLSPLSDKDARVDLGELMISLAYLSSAERLTVVVIKGRNLRIVDDTRNSSGNRFSSFNYKLIICFSISLQIHMLK